MTIMKEVFMEIQSKKKEIQVVKVRDFMKYRPEVV